MRRTSLLACSYTFDWLAGDPEWLPHPVRLMGWVITESERALRPCASDPRSELVAGGLLALVVPIASALTTLAVIRAIPARRQFLGVVIEVGLGSSCLATHCLLQEAGEVLGALEEGDLAHARRRLARIVGRDTASLDESEICRAVIETVAESLCDGIVAPLFYLALGGVPLAMAYKAVNTLDSMIGHRDQRYLYFGRLAARLDDVANWLPARMSSVLICLAAGINHPLSFPRALRIWLRDGARHASPNAGQPESAMAGALGVRLGGENHYGGERIVSPHLGAEFRRPDRPAARRALRLVAVASLLGFAAVLIIAGCKRAV